MNRPIAIRHTPIRILRCCLFLLLVPASWASFAAPLTVGIYHNPPQVFQDEAGKPKGIYVDLIRRIAQLEGWEIEFVWGSWAGHLEAIKSGELDLITTIAYTEERDRFADFTQTPVVSVWGQIYQQPNMDLRNIIDLDGKVIAVMKNGVYGTRLEQLCNRFDIQCTIMPVLDYHEVLSAVSQQRAHAGAVVSLFGFANEQQYRVKRSPIIYEPFGLRFATPEGQNGAILATIDDYMRRWKGAPDSFYYQTVNQYIEVDTPINKLPKWIKNSGLVLLFVALVVITWGAATRRLNRQLKREIRERKRSEAALETHNARLKHILDTAPVPMVLANDRDEVTYINPAFESGFGYGLGAFPSVSEWWARMIPDEAYRHQARQRLEERLEKNVDATVAFDPIELEVRARSGEGRQIEVSMIRLDEGERLITLYDISEGHARETKLNELTTQLQASNAELEQFAYVVSHDLRQPLRMVNSYVQLLERHLQGALNEETRLMMHFTTDGVQRMDQMLMSLLEYSRVGRLGEPMAPLDSRDALDEAIQFLQTDIEAAGAEITLSGEWPRLDASRNELTRLFQNLLSNAIKYRQPDARPAITVAVESESDGWRFVVADDGIGIDPGQMERLFRVFQRLHTREQYEGTGIGLAVSRKIVERHGGRIWVESEGAGHGCRFFFTIPRSRAA